MRMKESVLRDLIGSNLGRLVNSGLQGVYPDAFSGRALYADSYFTVQAPIVLSQLACSPATQVLSFLIMETDSMLRVGKRMFKESPRDEAMKLVVSANAEVLNFISSRLSWLLAKTEGIPMADISPPKVGNFTGSQAFRIRA